MCWKPQVYRVALCYCDGVPSVTGGKRALRNMLKSSLTYCKSEFVYNVVHIYCYVVYLSVILWKVYYVRLQ